MHRYLGVLTKSSLGPDANVVPKSRNTVVYQWSFFAGGVVAEKQVSVRYDNVKDRGVPLPDGWEVAFRTLVLPKIAQRSAAKAKTESSHDSLQCKVLGTALPIPELACPSQEEHVGSLMVLSGTGGSRRPVVLCAHVQGMEWFCYQCSDGDPADTIDIDDLVLDDVDSPARLDPTKEERQDCELHPR